MRRQRRNALVAAASVAVVAAVAVGWLSSRQQPSAAAAGSASGAVASLSSPGSADPSTTVPEPTLTPSSAPTPPPTRTATPTPVRTAAPKVSAATVPTPRPTPRPTPFHFPVPVSVGNARQIVTVSSSGSYANVVAWQLRGGVWRAVIQTKAARVGTHGVVPGSTRKQGTGTTPGGTYTMTEAFGIAANPGSAMPYHTVTSDDWWVEDNNSAYYNQMRRASQGGFDTSLPSGALNSSEHLVTYSTQYRYVVVINFNRPPNAVRYRGAGIFLHVNGTGSTAGCVSVPLATMVSIIDWLDPAQHPRIAIA